MFVLFYSMLTTIVLVKKSLYVGQLLYVPGGGGRGSGCHAPSPCIYSPRSVPALPHRSDCLQNKRDSLTRMEMNGNGNVIRSAAIQDFHHPLLLQLSL